MVVSVPYGMKDLVASDLAESLPLMETYFFTKKKNLLVVGGKAHRSLENIFKCISGTSIVTRYFFRKISTVKTKDKQLVIFTQT